MHEVDDFGRLIKVEEYTGNPTYSLYATANYQYDTRGLLDLFTDAHSNQTSITYDTLGRKTGMDDPDMGVWAYEYDLFGNLTKQTDARGTALEFEYDVLNRLTKKWDGPIGSGTLLSTFSYDDETGGNEGIGRRTGLTDLSGSTSWTFNTLGQTTDVTQTISGTAYTVSSTYDAFARALTTTYPDGEVLTNSFNALGALGAVATSLGGNYVSALAYNPAGQITSMLLGNGVTSTNTYDTDTARLTDTLSSKIPQNPLLDLTYSYDPGGNVTQILDGSRVETINYLYDELSRLTSAQALEGIVNPVEVIYERTYSYDEIGNLLSVGRYPSLPAEMQHAGSVGSASQSANGSRGRISGLTGMNYSGATHTGDSGAAFTLGGFVPAPT